MSEEEKTNNQEETKQEAPDAEEAPQEAESTATFEPVVQLEEVEVKSGEEDEEVVLSMRAKLFIFGETMLDLGTGNKTWRERGVGDVRILKHKEDERIRLLMRQEKTMKVIANHVLDPRITLEPNVGSDRSWVWSAFDFADGELVETVFAVRFADSDAANEFKDKFLECQEQMAKVLSGQDKPDEDGAAQEAAEALSALTTGGDGAGQNEE